MLDGVASGISVHITPSPADQSLTAASEQLPAPTGPVAVPPPSVGEDG